MICWIIVSDHRTQLFVGMRQHIIQNLIKAVTHRLQHSGLNINMLCQYTYNTLIYSIDILLIKNVDSDIFAF